MVNEGVPEMDVGLSLERPRKKESTMDEMPVENAADWLRLLNKQTDMEEELVSRWFIEPGCPVTANKVSVNRENTSETCEKCHR
jgi:hypothetical protein